MQYTLIAATLVGAVLAAPQWEQAYDTSVPATVYGATAETTSCTSSEAQVAYTPAPSVYSTTEEKAWGYSSAESEAWAYSTTESKSWGYATTTEEPKSYATTAESKSWESSTTTCTESWKETATGWYPSPEQTTQSYYATGAWSAPPYPVESSTWSAPQGYPAPSGVKPVVSAYPSGTAAPSKPAKSSPVPAPYTGAASSVKAAGLLIGAGAFAALFL